MNINMSTNLSANQTRTNSSTELAVDWAACKGHGVCAELLPDHITSDDWGYPILQAPPVPAVATKRARRAVADCPALALKLRAAARGTETQSS
jgi:ferredoxin